MARLSLWLAWFALSFVVLQVAASEPEEGETEWLQSAPRFFDHAGDPVQFKHGDRKRALTQQMGKDGYMSVQCFDREFLLALEEDHIIKPGAFVDVKGLHGATEVKRSLDAFRTYKGKIVQAYSLSEKQKGKRSTVPYSAEALATSVVRLTMMPPSTFASNADETHTHFARDNTAPPVWIDGHIWDNEHLYQLQVVDEPSTKKRNTRVWRAVMPEGGTPKAEEKTADGTTEVVQSLPCGVSAHLDPALTSPGRLAFDAAIANGSHPEHEMVLANAGRSKRSLGKFGKRTASAACLAYNVEGIMMDCSYVSAKGGPIAATAFAISNINQANAVYQLQLNMTISILEIIAQTYCDPYDSTTPGVFNRPCSSASYTINDRLSDFAYWRGTKNGGDTSTGIWHLYTQCGSGSIIGIAWPARACMTTTAPSTNGYVSGVSIVTVTTREWMISAHEMGHNFGSQHDCAPNICPVTASSACVPCTYGSDGCSCAKDKHIMYPTSDVTYPWFSDNTLTQICTFKLNPSALDTSTPSAGYTNVCLKTRGGVSSMTSNVCGNGIKEVNEDCDSGGMNTTCCTTDCKLQTGALCDPISQPCCTGTCQFSNNVNQICRPSTGFCDPAETCALNSGDCPPDLYATNGLSCPNPNPTLGDTYCATGLCTNRAQQCIAAGNLTIGAVRDCKGMSGSCALYCQDALGQCTFLTSNYFRDGTKCGIGSSCYDGVCQQSPLFEIILSWVQTNQYYSLGVLAGLVVFLLAGVWYFCHRARWLPKAVQYTKVEAYKRAASRRKNEIKKTAKTGNRREAYAVRGYRDEDEVAERKKSSQKGRRLSKSKAGGSSRSHSRSPSRSGSEDGSATDRSAAGGTSKNSSRRGSVITRRSSTNDQTPLLHHHSSTHEHSGHTPDSSKSMPASQAAHLSERVVNPLQRGSRIRRASNAAVTSSPLLGTSGLHVETGRPRSSHGTPGSSSPQDSPLSSPHPGMARRGTASQGAIHRSAIQPSRQSRLSSITASAQETPRRQSVLEDLPPAYTDGE